MSVQLLRRKFTIEQYHRMAETGILQPDDRVELIQGEIIEMSPIGTKHAATVNRLTKLFLQQLSQQVIVSVQNPVTLADTSEPQPDIAILKPRADFYASQHPQPRDIFLLIEVADRTVKFDQEVKIPLYAENRVAEVWLVDVNQEWVEVYRQPSSQGYESMQRLRRGQSLHLQELNDVVIAINEILG